MTFFASSFHQTFHHYKMNKILFSKKAGEEIENYANPLTAALGLFLPRQEASPLDKIEWL